MSSEKPQRIIRNLAPLPIQTKNKQSHITPLLNIVLGLGKQVAEARDRERTRARNRYHANRDRRVWREARKLVARRMARARQQRRKERARVRHARRCREARARRRRKLTHNRMSLEQIREMRDARRAAAMEKGLLSRREGESLDEFGERMERINRRFRVLWDRHKEGIREAEPRYLEGWPVRHTIRSPVIYSAEWGWVRTGTRTCVQCHFRGLPCSLTRWRWKRGRDEEVLACTRCVRNGERHECVVPERKGKEEKEDNGVKWRMVDADAKYSESVRKGETASEELGAEVDAVVQKWRDESKKIVVDIIGERMEEVNTSAFVLPRPKKWRRRRWGGW